MDHPRKRVVLDVTLLILLANMDEMVPSHLILEGFGYFICKSGQYLILVEAEFHLFVIEDLSYGRVFK